MRTSLRKPWSIPWTIGSVSFPRSLLEGTTNREYWNDSRRLSPCQNIFTVRSFLICFFSSRSSSVRVFPKQRKSFRTSSAWATNKRTNTESVFWVWKKGTSPSVREQKPTKSDSATFTCRTMPSKGSSVFWRKVCTLRNKESPISSMMHPRNKCTPIWWSKVIILVKMMFITKEERNTKRTDAF